MKYLVFSDTHLTEKFEAKKFQVLMKLISKADRVIVNGDFWDSFYTSFDKFVNSRWQELFHVLDQKDTVYIYGNHDPENLADGRIHRFCNKAAQSITIEIGDNTYQIEHGHNISPNLDMTYKSLVRQPLVKIAIKVVDKLLAVVFRDRYWKVYSDMNEVIADWVERNGINNILVCGHTHVQIDMRDRNYINTGVFKHGFAQAVFIDQSGVKFVNERY